MKRQRGFTLVELLLVVIIIGILAAVAVPKYQKFANRSKIAEAATMVRGIASAEMIKTSMSDTRSSWWPNDHLPMGQFPSAKKMTWSDTDRSSLYPLDIVAPGSTWCVYDVTVDINPGSGPGWAVGAICDVDEDKRPAIFFYKHPDHMARADMGLGFHWNGQFSNDWDWQDYNGNGGECAGADDVVCRTSPEGVY